ncbi:hypothetical protein [Streptomyces sp. I4(2020)]|uniref:hypothetical protein n=1 Tax=Streptomyces sp. I4(2020) TaxID=2760981 RepID=UPI0018EEA8C7|nr:hypothetical protein [Streptomyces sp. I4(2020)]MBJ6626264.1 hypothetical protein [Streptomyces sp. I4(2020)]
MTPWLRTLGATLVLGAGAVLLPYGPFPGQPGAAGVAYGAERTPGPDASDRTRTASRSPSAPASPSRSASPSATRSGIGPGEGRDRPGRQETAQGGSRDTAPHRRDRTEEEGTNPREAAGRPDGDGVRRPDARHDTSTRAEDDTAEGSPAGSDGVTPSGSASSAAVPAPATSSRAAEPGAAAGTAVGPVLRILPLGSGLVLMGLGFALAFLGLRMRQERGAR